MQPKRKIVIAGLGRMGRNHYRVLSENQSKFEVVGVVDPIVPDENLLNAKVKVVQSIEALDSTEYQCAIVAAPSDRHADLAIKFIERGKDILVEKPLAISYESCCSVVEAASHHGVKLAVGHVERHNPSVQKLREVISTQAFGQTINLSFTRVGGYPAAIRSPDNVILDLAVHDLDIVQWLVGKAKVIGSVCHSSWTPNVIDTAEILLKSAAGVSASVHVNWITPAKIRTLRATGTQGVCLVDYMLQTCSLLGGNLLANQQSTIKSDYSSLVAAYQNGDRIEFGIKKDEPLRAELEAFSRFLDGEKTDLCLGEEASSVVKLALEAVGSATKS